MVERIWGLEMGGESRKKRGSRPNLHTIFMHFMHILLQKTLTLRSCSANAWSLHQEAYNDCVFFLAYTGSWCSKCSLVRWSKIALSCVQLRRWCLPIHAEIKWSFSQRLVENGWFRVLCAWHVLAAWLLIPAWTGRQLLSVSSNEGCSSAKNMCSERRWKFRNAGSVLLPAQNVLSTRNQSHVKNESKSVMHKSFRANTLERPPQAGHHNALLTDDA